MNVSSYLNVAEILSAARALASFYPDICTYEDAPLRSFEGRAVPLLRVAVDSTEDKPAILVTAGVHAREWVPPDAAIYFTADLLAAYTGGTGLRYGAIYYDARDIRAMLAQHDLIVMPCVNPDGRQYSLDVDCDWRGNRNFTIVDGRQSYGVDLNRNYDFLWDFRATFHPDVAPASDDPFDRRQTFHGSEPASEPEVRNVTSAMERFNVRAMIDVHSYAPAVLHSWGHEASQSMDDQMSYLNPAFDGKRGIIADAVYREYHPAHDVEAVRRIAQSVSEAIRQVQGMRYRPLAAHALGATSGAGDDYAYSRHFSAAGHDRVLAFTLECGTEFQPGFPGAQEVMKEVAVALLEFGRVLPGAFVA